MIITAKDGKGGFKTAEECLAYEAELVRKEKEEKERIKKLEAEKESRYNEISKLYDEVVRKAREFEKDYGVSLSISNPMDFWNLYRYL